MGSETHVDIVSLLEEAELGLVGQIVHVLQLELLAPLSHELLGVFPIQDEGLDRQILLDDLLHFLLDGLQVLLGQLAIAQIHVIVEAVLGGGAVGKVRLREEVLDGLGHDMGSGVTDDVQFLLLGALCHRSVLVNDLHAFILHYNIKQYEKHD